MTIVFKFLPVAAIFLLASCSTQTDKKSDNNKTEVAETDSAAIETPEVPTNVPVINSITGVVTEIQNGKDGYTAKVKTTKQDDVFVTVSRVNLKDPQSYRTVKVGDTLHVIGEEWHMNEETHLKALELK